MRGVTSSSPNVGGFRKRGRAPQWVLHQWCRAHACCQSRANRSHRRRKQTQSGQFGCTYKVPSVSVTSVARASSRGPACTVVARSTAAAPRASLALGASPAVQVKRHIAGHPAADTRSLPKVARPKAPPSGATKAAAAPRATLAPGSPAVQVKRHIVAHPATDTRSLAKVARPKAPPAGALKVVCAKRPPAPTAAECSVVAYEPARAYQG